MDWNFIIQCLSNVLTWSLIISVAVVIIFIAFLIIAVVLKGIAYVVSAVTKDKKN